MAYLLSSCVRSCDSFVVLLVQLVIVDVLFFWFGIVMKFDHILQVLLIGGTTGTMLESMEVIGDTPDVHLDVSQSSGMPPVN